MYNNKISIIGTGYVGLVAGVCLADFGNQIINVDIDQKKIDKLKKGEVPLYEPGLQDKLRKNLNEDRITFTTDIESALRESEVIFIAVGTPAAENGEADLTAVRKVAAKIGKEMNGYKVVVNKSTVPVGTGARVEKMIRDRLKKRNKNYDFDVVSNPEFLREGKAVHDFTNPDRIIIGTESERAQSIMKDVYRSLYTDNVPFVFTNVETAELIKYSANAFLATKISFINEISVLCDEVGANVKEVSRAIGLDSRIGEKFLRAGPGYGGSCFPKDTRALVRTAESKDIDLKVVKAGIESNVRQKEYMVEKIEERLGDLEGKEIGILGLSFKPGTDDMRESPALTIIPELVDKGAHIKAYDPEAMENADRELAEYRSNILYCADEYEVPKGTDALVLVTEWNQFRRLDLERIKELMKEPIFFDFRNVYDRVEVSEYGFDYIGVGTGVSDRVQEEVKQSKDQIAATGG